MLHSTHIATNVPLGVEIDGKRISERLGFFFLINQSTQHQADPFVPTRGIDEEAFVLGRSGFGRPLVKE